MDDIISGNIVCNWKLFWEETKESVKANLELFGEEKLMATYEGID